MGGGVNDQQPRLPVLVAFGMLAVIGGVVGWVLSGQWKLAVIGVGVFFACSIIGAALDSQRKG